MRFRKAFASRYVRSISFSASLFLGAAFFVRTSILSPWSASRSILFVQELRAWTEQRYGRQQELADAIGVNKSVVSNWFAGRQFPTAEQPVGGSRVSCAAR